MATKLFLRNTTTNGITGAGVIYYDMLTAAGSSADTAVVDAVPSATEIQWTDDTTSDIEVQWISGRAPAGGFTLTSTDISIWAHESASTVNGRGSFRVYKRAANGTETELTTETFFNDEVELATTAAEHTWIGDVTNTAFAEDDRILLKIYLTNTGTMGSGTCTLTFNAADGTTGDSFFNLAETVAFKAEAPTAVDLGVATFQGVGTMAASALNLAPLRLTGTFQGVASFSGALTITSTPLNPDFTKYAYYLNQQGLVADRSGEGQRQTVTMELQPPEQDVRSTPNEIPSALGRYFAQTDFSHGSGQNFYHKATSDPAKFLHSEGFEIREGALRHLHAMALEATVTFSSATGRMTKANDLLFVCKGTTLAVATMTGGTVSWATEDPHAGQAAVQAQDVTTKGDVVYAALGASGVHQRDNAGTWTHYNDVVATKIAFLRDRLFVIGGTNSRSFFEVTASGAAPSTIKDLSSGWAFTDIFVSGAFIYATAINEGEKRSEVHHFGLNSAGTAIEHKGSTLLPGGQLIYSGIGHLGTVYLIGGKLTHDEGYDPILYSGDVSTDGGLVYAKVQEGEGAGALDLASRAITDVGEDVLIGWSLGADFPYGAREGMALYQPRLAAFFNHHHFSFSVTPTTLLDCTAWMGMHIWTTSAGVYMETETLVPQATLITSSATWGNAGLKDWNLGEVAHRPLPAATSVELEYTLEHPDENSWIDFFVSDTDDSTSDSGRLSNVESARFAFKLISNANGTGTLAPEIEAFSIRSNPTLAEGEYRLVRRVQIFGRDASSSRGEEIRQDPREIRDLIRDSYLQWVNWTEADTPTGWIVRVVQITEVMPQPTYDQTLGDTYDEGYIMQLTLEGTLA